jgi:hypothetical protein
MTVASFRWWFASSGERGEAIIALELRLLDWNEGDLSRRPKTDSGKPGTAARLEAGPIKLDIFEGTRPIIIDWK